MLNYFVFKANRQTTMRRASKTEVAGDSTTVIKLIPNGNETSKIKRKVKTKNKQEKSEMNKLWKYNENKRG